ncbi:PTS sugar transporter subunit IIB [Alkalihalophilus marmarensis]|uniref:PTS sugar transporter subunit IIB n=1 Tax=Alkalihalophilus marmarensis TaxID=521377 RepID=UPI002E24EE93|nr:PTS sugar transporter subunit IIB [Alkalihalophilus marmarensis]
MSIPTVLIACGAGIATSTIVCERVETLFKEQKVRAQVIQCMISEVSSLQDGASLVISTTILPRAYNIPSIIATAYISGVGMEELDQKILNLLKK